MERSFIDLYREVAPSPRPDFLWGWVLRALDATRLPGVRPDLRGACTSAKFLAVMLDVVLDDIADGGTDPEAVSTLLDAVFRGRALEEVAEPLRPTARYGRRLVHEVDALVAPLPGYTALREFLAFDRLQLESAMRYSALVNAFPAAANVAENRAYLCHNMNMVVQGTIDLMARETGWADELGDVRALLYLGQRMGRIGNAITTWAREVDHGDLTSVVFPLLRERSGRRLTELARMPADELAALEERVGAEAELLARWCELRAECQAPASRIRSFDAHDYVRGLDALLSLHLASRGLK